MGILKKLFILSCIVLLIVAVPCTVYAAPEDEEPVPEITDAYEVPETEPQPEPETEYIPETEPPTEPVEIYTDPEPYPEEEQITEYFPEEEPETDVVPEATEPLTDSYEIETVPQTYPTDYLNYLEEYIEPSYNNYINDILKLPTLMDSTDPAEKRPSDFGADSENGGVSYAGGITCWVCVGVALIVLLGFVISSTGRVKSGG